MSLKGQRTTAGFIPWTELTTLLLKMQRDGEFRFCLLIALGSFTGLRISDIRSLKWIHLLNSEFIILNETKTGKHRKLKINSDLRDIIGKCNEGLNFPNENDLILANRFGTKAMNTQWINLRLKEIAVHYSIKISNMSSHSLRKTFGRKVWEMNNYSEKSLLLLSEIFNHSSVAITKRYLGIKEEEILDVYDQLCL